MENNNTRNSNTSQRPPIDPIAQAPKKFSNKIIAIIVLAIIAAIGSSYIAVNRQSKIETTNQSGNHNQNVSTTNDQNALKIWEDGTAYVKGEVIDHVSGCEVDGACKLIINANNQKVVLVYAEGDFQCLNTQAVSWVHWDQNVRVGTKVKAYGAYRKMSNMHELTFCDSKEYFILGENDPVPLGAYTEKFFDEVAKAKGEAYIKQFEEAQKSGEWDTYKNEQFGYEFSFPATWSSPQVWKGDPSFHIFYQNFSDQSSKTIFYLTLKNAFRLNENSAVN